MDLSDLRRDFGKQANPPVHWPGKPFSVFDTWLQHAIDQGIPEANAMVLATCGSGNTPSTRIVLLKEFSESGGFVFYTNYNSRKGKALAVNPRASLHVFWRELERQISIEGPVEKVPAIQSDAYFRSRPRESQISAALSPQSRELTDPESLKKQWQQYHNSTRAIQRPSNWGGYRLLAERIEFWQGGEHRLHHRMVYTKTGQGWTRKRLAP